MKHDIKKYMNNILVQYIRVHARLPHGTYVVTWRYKRLKPDNKYQDVQGFIPNEIINYNNDNNNDNYNDNNNNNKSSLPKFVESYFGWWP